MAYGGFLGANIQSLMVVGNWWHFVLFPPDNTFEQFNCLSCSKGIINIRLCNG